MGRIDFLKDKYKIQDIIDYDQFIEDVGYNIGEHGYINVIRDSKKDNKLIYIQYKKELESSKIKYSFSKDIFDKIMGIDPTKHKMYVQWVLKTLIKSFNDINRGEEYTKRIINEDLDKIGDAITLFDNNKRKKSFTDNAKMNNALNNINDYGDINQYTLFEELFDATYPFREIGDLSELEISLHNFHKNGTGKIVVNDDKFIVFIPKTREVSVVFSFTTWCTARPGNSMFKQYRNDYPFGDGKNSELIIFIRKEFFKSQDMDDIYQLHIESDQLHNGNDKTLNNNDFKRMFIDQSLGIKYYLSKYLLYGFSTNANQKYSRNYKDRIISWGLGHLLFDVIDEDKTDITFEEIELSHIPDSISKMKKLNGISLRYTNIDLINENYFSLPDITYLSVPFNKIERIPSYFSKGKKMVFMNLTGNPINYVSDDLKYLDKSNGGSLEIISVSDDNKYLIKKINELLPSVKLKLIKQIT